MTAAPRFARLAAWTLLSPLLIGNPILAQKTEAQVVPASDDAKELEALATDLAKELAAEGFEVDLERLSIVVREPDDCVGDLARQLDRRFPPAHFEGLRVLYPALGRDLGETDAEMREQLARALAGSLAAYYEFTSDALVFVPGVWLEAADRESRLLHELVHAWRDQRSDLEKLFGDSGDTVEAANIAWCLSEGEAALVATSIFLARGGAALGERARALFDDPGASFGLSLPRTFGAGYLADRYGAGGWKAVDNAWTSRPPSSEQLIHPEKLGADTPTTVTLPPWPEDAGEVELLYETTLGEMGVLTVLLDSFADAFDARRASIGWDGDFLRVYHSPMGHTIVFRSVWDREEDARQFAELWKRQSKGKVVQTGRVVDWVHSDSSRTRRQLLKALAALSMELEESPADARSTARIEESLDFGDRPHVREGEWVVPAFGLRLPAPEGWVSREVGSLPALCAPPIDGSSDLIGVQLVDSVTDDLEEFRHKLVLGMAGREHVFVESSLVSVGGVNAVFDRIRNRTGFREKVQATLRIPRGDSVLMVTAAVAGSRWKQLEAEVEASLGGLRFDSATEEGDAGSKGLERFATARRFESLRLPVSAHGIADDRDPEEYRAVINLLADGGIVALHEDLLDLPAASRLPEDSATELRDWLYRAVKGMGTKWNAQSGALPAEDLLIRADTSTPFYFVQKVMENCGYRDIQLWKIELAVALEPDELQSDSRESSGTEGLLHAHLPLNVWAEMQKVEVQLAVKDEGTKLDARTGRQWKGEPGTSFVHGSDRVVEYTISGRSTQNLEHVRDFLKRFGEAEGEWGVTIDARTGTTCGEVVRVMEAALDAGLTAITFVGSYD